jgi:hypothetical protein
MYYHASDTIAQHHIDLADTVARLDAYLYANQGTPVRLGSTADFLSLDEDILSNLLELYERQGVVTRHRLPVCPQCDMVIEEEEPSVLVLCDLCEGEFDITVMAHEVVYTPRTAPFESGAAVPNTSTGVEEGDGLAKMIGFKHPHRVCDEVGMLHDGAIAPTIMPDCLYSHGSTKRILHHTSSTTGEDQRDVEKRHTVTVLFVAGDRGGSQRHQIQTPREFNAIDEALRACEYRDTFYLARPILAATHQKFVEAYRHRPAILHFAGHGDNRSLTFISDEGSLVSQTPVTEEQLAAILGSFPDRVRLCVLNTCNSASVAKHLVDTHVADAAVGWPAQLADAAAIAFSRALYGRLGDGLSLSRSIALAAQSYGSEESPELYTDEGIDPDVTNFVTRTEA